MSSSGLKYNSRLLFTPGPLGVSLTTKEAMLFDLGSRDPQFLGVVAEIRTEVLRAGGLSQEDWTAVPMQGSGTFGVESSVQTTVPRDGKMLVLINGSYGRRICDMASTTSIPFIPYEFEEDQEVDPEVVGSLLAQNPDITNVMVVHCETSSGMINPITEIGKVIKEHKKEIVYMIDSMSGYGGIVTDFDSVQADVIVTSANKCIQGVPGFSWVFLRKDVLERSQGNARSLCLDLYRQHDGLTKTGQFRFTPPTHVILAFRRALIELEEEGGINARAQRYQNNARIIWDEFGKMGFQRLLKNEKNTGHIITTYLLPDHPHFTFEKFYSGLSEKGCNIYPGKITKTPCFRVGHIGHLFPQDMKRLVSAAHEVLREMDVPIPVPPPKSS
eukprot:CAMPEP_0201497520 /NCGR_PEP_ID=MMETSP0151_2-20130828/66103_1 /ASSEMBLY_ACC=CAM_ASM_000257 /TAXON_ID=200890 /ORGANISM="Paramoeba atlantica, Strain 621/1 / CCAP 1560/9" /LENGTH=385 /DNA_ID=CAMNT_0047888285 /DNA_START=36 /DNA_END=1193 /DNA_ORIENTATION=-